jgi:hypothetical protein
MTIALIDGVFGGRPAVWHKEILWALSRGVHLVGGASMGALRAAELADYGMIGVGWVFEAYRSGAIEADDEVAVLHGPAELGSLPLSEPLVNVRHNLERAAAAGLIGQDEAAALLTLAARRHFTERSWPALLMDARAGAAVTPEALARLEAWRATHGSDCKRNDARLVLARLEKIRSTAPPPFQPAFTLNITPYLRRQLQRVQARRSSQGLHP